MDTKSLNPKIVKKEEGIKLNVLGYNQIIKVSGKDTNGAFALVEQNNQPGVGIPMHSHQNEDEIFHVLEGNVEMTIQGKTTVLEAGDLIFCPKGIPHARKIVGDVSAKAILSIYPSGLENMFDELSKLPQGPPDLNFVAQICGKYEVSFG
jgi:quercetin dioxygenase-like cupin family protein